MKDVVIYIPRIRDAVQGGKTIGGLASQQKREWIVKRGNRWNRAHLVLDDLLS